MKAATGQSTVPQVFVGGRLLGGAAEVLPQLESGALQQLLADTTAPPLPAGLQDLVKAGAAASQKAQAAAAPAEGGERAQLRDLATELRTAVAKGSGHTFTLQQAVQWLQQSKGLAADAAAAALGQLQSAQLLTAVGATPGDAVAQQAITVQLAQQRPQLLLQLTADAPQPARWKDPLNGQYTWFGPARPADEVRVVCISDLQAPWLAAGWLAAVGLATVRVLAAPLQQQGDEYTRRLAGMSARAALAAARCDRHPFHTAVCRTRCCLPQLSFLLPPFLHSARWQRACARPL